MRAWVLAVGAVVALGVTGCGKHPSPPAPAGATERKAPPRAAADAEHAPPEEPKAPPAAKASAAPAKGDPTQAGATQTSTRGASAGPVAGDRTKMGEAFVEIYCAQQAGEADKLLAIYKRYGFQDPKAWTKAWTEAAKDEPWIARLTERAVAKCPPKR